jgi:L-ascorbate metabolism protein UlaG (beta-lactamase superfamily)
MRIIPDPPDRVAPVPDRLTWLGHATVLVELGRTRLLTDPVLRGRVAHLRRHGPKVPAPRDVDAVLLSHAHRDHLDLPTLRALTPPPHLIVVPTGVGRTLRRLTGTSVREVQAGERLDVGSVQVAAVPAVHDGRRSPVAQVSASLGYVLSPVDAERPRVYFAGDTMVDDAMRGLGPIDIALMPIWGWGPSLGPGHMDPGEAVDALELIRPRIAVPIHYGTLLPIGLRRRYGHVLRDPLESFQQQAAQRVPQTTVAVLRAGEDLAL